MDFLGYFLIARGDAYRRLHCYRQTQQVRSVSGMVHIMLRQMAGDRIGLVVSLVLYLYSGEGHLRYPVSSPAYASSQNPCMGFFYRRACLAASLLFVCRRRSIVSDFRYSPADSGCFFIMLEVVVLLASDSLHGDYLRPVLSGGMGRVTNQVWPVGVTTTYGECYVMGAFWYMLRKKQYAGRIGFCAAIFAGVFVVLFNILAITALGEYLFQRMIFPAYAILTLSSIADFLENLEVLGAIYFFVFGFRQNRCLFVFSRFLYSRTYSFVERSIGYLDCDNQYLYHCYDHGQ